MRKIVEQGARDAARDNRAMTQPMRLRSIFVAVAFALAVTGCSPAFDWREFVPEGSGVGVSFPCRPDRATREVTVAGAKVTMQMLACSASDVTYALGFFDVDGPARVTASLDALRAIAIGNIAGSEPRLLPLQIKGMTPNDRAGRLDVVGHRPDGKAVQEHAAFFAHGLRVYQAVVIGQTPPAQAVEPFFGGLKFPG
jgi:hypothetical protein